MEHLGAEREIVMPSGPLPKYDEDILELTVLRPYFKLLLHDIRIVCLGLIRGESELDIFSSRSPPPRSFRRSCGGPECKGPPHYGIIYKWYDRMGTVLTRPIYLIGESQLRDPSSSLPSDSSPEVTGL